MNTRAIWKGTIEISEIFVPVKLYSAVEDRTIHFRLLHEKDKTPVRQVMVDPEKNRVVPKNEIKRGYITERGDVVILDEEELESLEPDSSRNITLIHFFPVGLIDPRWYVRPYFLGPDQDQESYFSLIKALNESKKEGLVRWVMRHKEYNGVLRMYHEFPVLITLRYTEEMISLKDLKPPSSPGLSKKELFMADKFIDMLADTFDPSQYHDQFRERVKDLIQAKTRGETIKVKKYKQKESMENLEEALKESLKAAGERKSA